MQKNKFNWKIGGEAGYGIMTAGAIFSKICSLYGLNIFTSAEYPSLIRGGYNSIQVRTDTVQLFAQKKEIDILIALNQETIDKNKKDLAKDGIILYDEGLKITKGIPIPFTKIAKTELKNPLLKNAPALGATLGFLCMDFRLLKNELKKRFKKKGKKIVNANIKAAKQGYELGLKHSKIKITKIKAKNNILIDGNTAITLGAIKSGCKFMSAYPMTPATSIMQTFVKFEKDFGLIMKQTEDEISALNMALGASFSGVRSMTATSGGGFSLMTEGLGLASSAEIPIVIINAQRPGPSTGLPTRTEQGDLNFMISASQGDFPRIVLAVGDVEECFYETANAFNLADKYQLPVIILTDKHLATSYTSTKKLNENKIKINRGKLLRTAPKDYKRYAFTSDGISPRIFPGTKNVTFTAAGDEHNEEGEIEEDCLIRNRMMEKRMKKLKQFKPKIKNYGKKNAKTTIVGWGSTKGAILEALTKLDNVKFLQIVHLEPFPTKQVKDILSKSKKVLLVENNYSGQLGTLIKKNTCIDIKNKYLKYDGRPFFANDIVNEVKKL